MKRKKALSLFLYCIVFALAFSTMIGAGFYRKTIPNESVGFKLDIAEGQDNQKNVKPVIIDIQNQGLPKRLVQPGAISISKCSITNKGKEPIWIQVKVDGFKVTTKIASSNPWFDEKTERFNSPILPGKSLSLNVNLDIPLKSLNTDYKISTGAIVLSDSNSGKLFATIPVNIINSVFKKPN